MFGKITIEPKQSKTDTQTMHNVGIQHAVHVYFVSTVHDNQVSFAPDQLHFDSLL